MSEGLCLPLADTTGEGVLWAGPLGQPASQSASHEPRAQRRVSSFLQSAHRALWQVSSLDVGPPLCMACSWQGARCPLSQAGPWPLRRAVPSHFLLSQQDTGLLGFGGSPDSGCLEAEVGGLRKGGVSGSLSIPGVWRSLANEGQDLSFGGEIHSVCTVGSRKSLGSGSPSVS